MKNIKDHFGWKTLVLCVLFISVQRPAFGTVLYCTNYPTIQAAVDDASSGDTICIAGRDHYEQVVITNKNLTLAGEPGATLHAFSGMQQTLLDYGVTRYPLIGMRKVNVILSGLTLNGERLGNQYPIDPNILVGAYFLASSGTVTNCNVTGFRAETLSQVLYCYGILVRNPVSLGFETTVAVLDSTLTDNVFSIEMSGDVIQNPELLRITATVSGNSIIGPGPGSIPCYGVWFNTGVAGEVTGNTLMNHIYTGTGLNFVSAIDAYDGAAKQHTAPGFVPLQPLRFEGNTFSNNTGGMVLIGGNSSHIVNNKFLGRAPGVASWGALAVAGTNIVVANNNFSDLPAGIVLAGGGPFGIGWPAIMPVQNPNLYTNWFCNISTRVRTNKYSVFDLREEGTQTCPAAVPAVLYSTNYPTLQAAVDAANSGDTICIAAGDYSEQVVVTDKSLTLAGEPGATLHAFPGMTQTLSGYGAYGTHYPLIGIDHANVMLSGLTLNGERLGNLYPISTDTLVGTYFLASNGSVTNCNVMGFRGEPLSQVLYCYGILVRNNVNWGFETAAVAVLDSTLTDNVFSIQLVGDAFQNPESLQVAATVRGNTIIGPGPGSIPCYGVWIGTGVAGEVTGNTLMNHIYTGTGLNFVSAIDAYDAAAKQHTPPAFVPLQPIRFAGNTFSNNTGGMVLVGGNNSQVVNNKFLGNAPGIASWDALAVAGTNIVVANNNFSDLTTGIVLPGLGSFGNGWPAIMPVQNPNLYTNWFCNVITRVRPYYYVFDLREEETQTCPFTGFLSIAKAPNGNIGMLLRGWHGDSVMIESSTNLVDWVRFDQPVLELPTYEYLDLNGDGAPFRFYRLRSHEGGPGGGGPGGGDVKTVKNRRFEIP